MKRLIFIFGLITLLVAFSGWRVIDTQNARSNQAWIEWIGNPHVATSGDMVDITIALWDKEIKPDSIYTLSSGIRFKIAHPEEYLKYICLTIKSIRPETETLGDVVKAISSGEETRWGNDISYVVKNYYYSEKYGKVLYNGNYSGAKFNVPVLLIDGIPAFKLDCGNPLVLYPEDYVPKYTKAITVADSIKTGNGENDTVYIIIQLEKQEMLESYPTVYCTWRPLVGWSYSTVWTCPTYFPFFSIPLYEVFYWNSRSYYSCNSWYFYDRVHYHGYGVLYGDYYHRHHFWEPNFHPRKKITVTNNSNRDYNRNDNVRTSVNNISNRIADNNINRNTGNNLTTNRKEKVNDISSRITSNNTNRSNDNIRVDNRSEKMGNSIVDRNKKTSDDKRPSVSGIWNRKVVETTDTDNRANLNQNTSSRNVSGLNNNRSSNQLKTLDARVGLVTTDYNRTGNSNNSRTNTSNSNYSRTSNSTNSNYGRTGGNKTQNNQRVYTNTNSNNRNLTYTTGVRNPTGNTEINMRSNQSSNQNVTRSSSSSGNVRYSGRPTSTSSSKSATNNRPPNNTRSNRGNNGGRRR